MISTGDGVVGTGKSVRLWSNDRKIVQKRKKVSTATSIAITDWSLHHSAILWHTEPHWTYVIFHMSKVMHHSVIFYNALMLTCSNIILQHIKQYLHTCISWLQKLTINCFKNVWIHSLINWNVIKIWDYLLSVICAFLVKWKVNNTLELLTWSLQIPKKGKSWETEQWQKILVQTAQ